MSRLELHAVCSYAQAYFPMNPKKLIARKTDTLKCIRVSSIRNEYVYFETRTRDLLCFLPSGKHNNDLSHQYRIYNNFPTIKCFNQLENKFVDAWNTSFSTASKVLGSAGTQFKNGVTKKDTLQVFGKLCSKKFLCIL